MDCGKCLMKSFHAFNYLRLNPIFGCGIIKCCFTLMQHCKIEEGAKCVLQPHNPKVFDERDNEIVQSDLNLAGHRRFLTLIDVFQ